MNKSEGCHTENHDVPPFEGSFDCVHAKLVRPERFELPTYSSGGCRSIQLSYGRAAVMQVYIVRPEWLNRREEAKLRSAWTPVPTRTFFAISLRPPPSNHASACSIAEPSC